MHITVVLVPDEARRGTWRRMAKFLERETLYYLLPISFIGAGAKRNGTGMKKPRQCRLTLRLQGRA